MTGGIKIRYDGKYIILTVPVDHMITSESDRYMWLLLANACKEHGCKKVLLEGPEPRRDMQLNNAFVSAKHMARINAGARIACCFEGEPPDELSNFFMDKASSRSVQMKYFHNKSEGLEWLDAVDVD